MSLWHVSLPRWVHSWSFWVCWCCCLWQSRWLWRYVFQLRVFSTVGVFSNLQGLCSLIYACLFVGSNTHSMLRRWSSNWYVIVARHHWTVCSSFDDLDCACWFHAGRESHLFADFVGQHVWCIGKFYTSTFLVCCTYRHPFDSFGFSALDISLNELF